MAQTDFTRENAKNAHEAVDEMFQAIPKSKRMGYLGHLNDVLLFLEGCIKTAPEAKS